MIENNPSTNQKYTRVGHKTKIQDDKILHLEIDPLVEGEIKVVIEEIIMIRTITGKIIEIDQEADGTTIGQVIEVVIIQITTDKVI